jgi:ubiquinone/menaquinone biosynthesis C-methylase UbiE
MTGESGAMNQCKKPSGWLGRFTLWRMNKSHSKLTDWGLEHVTIGRHDSILDVGCGGGRTVGKLAAIASEGRIYGVDYSEESVAATKRNNAELVTAGRVEVRHGLVSELPFGDGMFDLVTGIETHFWWPDLSAGMREILRVLKPGGTLVLIAEIYKGASRGNAKLIERYADRAGMTLLTAEEHRRLFEDAGFSDIEVEDVPAKAWICAAGRRP